MLLSRSTKILGNLFCLYKVVLTILCCIIGVIGKEENSDLSEDLKDYQDTSTQVLPEAEKNVAGRFAFLDKLLDKKLYDKRAWPNYSTGQPTEVSVNVHVNSMDNINAANMEFGMDIYLRQSWLDRRLNFAKYGINQSITLNGEELLHQIWKPDLFFRNLKSASFHKVTVPNELIRLEPSGYILFSMRLTLRLSCFMSFRNYPLDKQKCWVIIGPYAQTTEQVIIHWQKNTPFSVETELELPEFDIIFEEPGQFLRHTYTGNFSFLNISFILIRQNGYHLVQTYLPTFLIVMISWVSFWLNADAAPARVTLGVTTLLALTTVSSGIRTQLPPVSYVKAIDLWIGACSIMVFGALLEFTLVNYLSRRKIKPPEKRNMRIFFRVPNLKSTSEKQHGDICESKVETSSEAVEVTLNIKKATFVDRTCRVLFPLAFLVFNIIYWTYYLHFS